MAKIDGESFTVTFIEDSNYESNGETTQGVKITTKEEFTIDGEKCSKFHTTRVALVRIFNEKQLRIDVNDKNDPMGPVKCISQKSNSGKDFFNLVDV